MHARKVHQYGFFAPVRREVVDVEVLEGRVRALQSVTMRA
jgi:hypothetical protein